MKRKYRVYLKTLEELPNKWASSDHCLEVQAGSRRDALSEARAEIVRRDWLLVEPERVVPLEAFDDDDDADELVVVCAWCPDKLDREMEALARGQSISHGICRDCRRRLELDEFELDETGADGL
jgi:hypothetical protein